MPEFSSWKQDKQALRRASGRGLFLKLDQGVHRLRFLTRPVEYHCRWKPVPCRIDPERDPFLGDEDKPRTRYSCMVAETDGEPRLLDFGASIRNAMAEWSRETRRDPSAPDAPLFAIRVTGEGLRRRYSVMPLSDGGGPREPHDREQLEETLLRMRRPHTLDEIRAKMAKAGVLPVMDRD